ncbi:50S ribosomal protein L37ae [Candidatus Bathyarchaeota archaeon]|nr:MAG: 50S ribosomal protein L37ae [Candidatus Bathyarchaeota archaeon]
MGRTRKVGPAGSFGPRYGSTLRKRWARIINAMRAPHRCPRCRTKAVKRVSVGVWRCRKCGLVFAGGAYVPYTKVGDIARRASAPPRPR